MRARMFVVLLAAGSIALTGSCGNDQPNRDVASLNGQGGAAANPAQSEEELKRAAERYEQCMNEHGIQGGHVSGNGDGQPSGQVVPTEIPGEPVTPEEMNKAREECRQFLPNGGTAPTPDAEALDKQREWIRCLRDNGLNARDPVPGDHGPVVGIPTGDPEAKKKLDDCTNQIYGQQPQGGPTR